jgi:hypothetical protein
VRLEGLRRWFVRRAAQLSTLLAAQNFRQRLAAEIETEFRRNSVHRG